MYKKMYEKEIANGNKDYQISLSDFLLWLTTENKTEAFKNVVEEEGIYGAAVDFSIPVIMVKFLIRMW